MCVGGGGEEWGGDCDGVGWGWGGGQYYATVHIYECLENGGGGGGDGGLLYAFKESLKLPYLTVVLCLDPLM